jgi:uncharacterized protein YecE (DUF72 family)
MLSLPNELDPYSQLLSLGTSSWSFPGWSGIVYTETSSEQTLARQGLKEYSQHTLLSGAGIDRGFYQGLSTEQYAHYAEQVPAHFRFTVKAPAIISDAVLRNERGAPTAENPQHLNLELARQNLHACQTGLHQKLGTWVWQVSPLGRQIMQDYPRWVERLQTFLITLRAEFPELPMSLEMRDSAALTPRLMRVLGASRTSLCIGLHTNMPPISRQLSARTFALSVLNANGPLVVRWSLRVGARYQAAKANYAPFNQLVDADDELVDAIAQTAIETITAGQRVLITVNNKAEGCAPLTLQRIADRMATKITQLSGAQYARLG